MQSEVVKVRVRTSCGEKQVNTSTVANKKPEQCYGPPNNQHHHRTGSTSIPLHSETLTQRDQFVDSLKF